MYIKARSLLTKIDLLQAYIETFNLDVVFVTETWFHQNVLNGEVNINGYECYGQDRADRIGGGVAIYVKTTIQCARLDNIGRFKEALWCKLIIGSEQIVVGVVYRSPGCKQDEEDWLTEALRLSAQNSRILVIGDLDYPDIDWINWTADKAW